MNSNTKVVYLLSEFGSSKEGGSSLSGFRIEALLRKNYNDLTVITDTWKYNPFNNRNVIFLKYRILLTPKFKQIIKYFIVCMLNLFKLSSYKLDANNKDLIIIVNSFSFIPERLICTNYKSIKKICIIRGDVNSFDYQPYSDGGALGDLNPAIEFLNNQDFIIYVSKTIRSNWEKMGISKKKSFYLPNSINENKPKQATKKLAAKFCNFDSNEFNIVIVGTIQTRKGQDIFSNIACELESYKNIKIHFIGNIAEKFKGNEIVNQINETNNNLFIFHGHKDNALDYVHAADLCILSSRSEAFPRTIAEYMFYGKPIISSRVAGADEMIIDKESGLLFDIDDHESLIKQIDFIYKHYDEAMLFGRNAKKRYQENYSANQQEENFFNILNIIESNK
jgi:glycosyltransferase involved in cell wall biosynthesis